MAYQAGRRDGLERAAKVPASTPSAQAADPMLGRDKRVAVLLTQLVRTLDDPRGERNAVRLAVGAGKDRLQAIESNIRRIGITDLQLRYLGPAELSDPGSHTSTSSASAGIPGQADQQSGIWAVRTRLTWRVDTYEPARNRLEITLQIADDGNRARFAGIAPGADGHRVPLWLLQPLEVRRGERTLVMAADSARLRLLHKLATRALGTVAQVLPDWQGALVVAEPAAQALLDQAVGASPGQTVQLAGVTTTADGSAARAGQAQVLLNPEVFGRLGARAAQIVVSHEATHVATEAAASQAPQWLVEGFADYVALRDSEADARASARQFLNQVRSGGVPTRLPRDRDFTDGDAGVGGDYEEHGWQPS